MHKKSEVNSLILIYMISIVAVGFTLYLSFGGINQIKHAEKNVELNNFIVTLENSLNSQRSKDAGSVLPVSLSAPSGIETICFVDDKELLSPQTYLGLDKEKQFYKDRNVFFFPSEVSAPAKISFFKLNNSENPLCVKSVNNKINLILTAAANSTLIKAVNKEDKSQTCIIVSGSSVGNSNEKIDVLFLGYGYNNKTLLAQDVNDYVSGYIFQTEPFLSNKGKFNLWMIDNQQPNCSMSGYIMCDSLSINKIASDCPHDYTFVLVNKNVIRSSIRSSAISNIAKINTRDNKLVILHEFGHTFGGLADEYTDQYYQSWFDAKDYPNCDYSSCPKWKSMTGTGCLQGCSTNSFYRSVDYSIMRDYDKINTFGALNEKIIADRLGAYR